MTDLRITLVQTPLVWEDKEANRTLLTQKIAPLKGKTDVIILPEMFTTGFSMNASELGESMNGTTMNWLSEQAAQYEAVICGSIIIKENNCYYNRFIWMQSDGTYHYYDKRHLFALGQENETFTSGANQLIIDYKGWKICPLICYDLRFPVWSRNTCQYDLLLYVANWPSARSQAWKALLQARAIENQVYTVGVNMVGQDGKGLLYSGDSSLYDYVGNLRFRASHEECVFTTTLNFSDQQKFKEKFPFLADRDTFEVRI